MTAESTHTGLHPCRRCGIELDADDRHELCEECEVLDVKPVDVRTPPGEGGA